jgi:hypothetical protein
MSAMPHDRWQDVSAARLRAANLAALAPVRNRQDVRIFRAGEVAWVRWAAGGLEIVRCLHPVAGVTFFTCRDGQWFPLGSRIPVEDRPPDGDGLSVAAVLVPGQFEPTAPGATVRAPVVLRVVRGGEPKPVTALACTLDGLAAWADRTTTRALEAVRAARAGDRVVLLGAAVPSIPAAQRYWGDDVLVPTGFRPEPDLPYRVIREAAGAATDELLLLDEAGAEMIPRAVFEPLTRAGVRLATRPA